MSKILLACAAGMSTSIVVSKMKKYSESIGANDEILALPSATALERFEEGWEVILLGPQVRFLENQFKQVIADKKMNIPVGVINFSDYGMANGEAIYKTALKLLGK